MSYIKSIEINDFRGVRELTISDLSSINLIVGDNNSGKTTIMEAIQLLFADPSLGAIKRIIDQRTLLKTGKSSFSLICLMNLRRKTNLDSISMLKKKKEHLSLNLQENKKQYPEQRLFTFRHFLVFKKRK